MVNKLILFFFAGSVKFSKLKIILFSYSYIDAVTLESTHFLVWISAYVFRKAESEQVLKTMGCLKKKGDVCFFFYL